MIKRIAKVVSMATVLLVSPLVGAQPSVLDNTKPWSERMIESEMVRFPEAWQIDWDESAQWDYVHGLNLLAVSKVYQHTKNQRYLDYILGYYDMLVNDDGTISTYDIDKYNIDMINPGKVLFFLYEETGQTKYKKAADLLRKQLDSHPRTNEGGFWHKKRYPEQMWLDGLYMGAPFYAEYIVRYGDMAELDDVFLQFELIEANLYDEKTGLPRHGWDASKAQKWADETTGLSAHHWSRALGWYAMAMVDVLEIVPAKHPKSAWLRAKFQTFIDATLAYQDNTGTWYQVTDLAEREGNYLEASGTSMITYAIAKGVALKLLPEHYRDHAEKGFAGLIDQMISVNPSDNVISLNQVCAVAGLGGKPYRDGSFDYYLSEPIRANDAKGVGPFILAALYLGK
jgi:unsaturated rhamnogalacturonyl hydrolase